jgi:tetratricopeptide (TPR) repeat protein
MLVVLAETYANLSYIDQAQTCVDKALAEARQLQQPYALVAALGFGSYALWPSGSSLAATRYAEEMIAVSVEQGFLLWLGWGMVHRGWSLTTLGRAEEGRSSLMEGLSMIRAAGQINSLPWLLILLAEAHAKLDEPAEGLKHLAEAARLTEMVMSELLRLSCIACAAIC